MFNRLKSEPAVVISFVGAVLALAVTFGFSLTADQTAAVMLVVTLGVGIVTRSQVTPTSAVAAEVVKGKVVTGEALPPAGQPADVVTNADGVTSRFDSLYDEQSERGAYTSGSLLVALACLVVIAVGLVWLAKAF